MQPKKPMKPNFVGLKKRRIDFGKGLKVYWIEHDNKGRPVAIWQKRIGNRWKRKAIVVGE